MAQPSFISRLPRPSCTSNLPWSSLISDPPPGLLSLQVTSCIYNIILGKLYIDHYGTMKISGNRGLSARLRFKERSMFDRDPHQVGPAPGRTRTRCA